MHVAVGDHRAPTIPPTISDDVHSGCVEGVGRANDRSDVEVVLPVLDGDMKRMPLRIEIRDDRVKSPVPVLIDDVAAVAVGQKFGVVTRIVRPGQWVWTNADNERLVGGRFAHPTNVGRGRRPQATAN